MRFASLGSGSKGNATLIEYCDTCIMLDCGFSVRDTVRRLARLGKTPDDLSAILVTHEHSDHWKGVLPLASKFAIKIYATAGCLISCGMMQAEKLDRRLDKIDTQIINSHSTFAIEDIKVTPVPVPHDAREPVQYVFNSRAHQLGVLTDIGSVTAHVEALYRDCDGLLIEANHDVDMLLAGPYPAFLKKRVAGPWGHLSNQQAAQFIQTLDRERLQQLVIGHISEKNNSLDKIRSLIGAVFSADNTTHYASSEAGFDWIELQ